MTVRITKTTLGAQTVLRIDGRLRSDDIEELFGAFRSAPSPPILDLSNLQSADREGVGALRGLIALGAGVSGASPFIELLLQKKTERLS